MIRNRIVQLSGGAVVGMSEVALIFANALDEIAAITRLRLERLLATPSPLDTTPIHHGVAP